jgi:Domain of unknown function (DUF4440)
MQEHPLGMQCFQRKLSNKRRFIAMRRIFIFLAIAICSASYVNAQEAQWLGGKGQNVAEIKKDVMKLKDDIAQATKNKDAKALCNLMADGWAGTTEVGATIHKAQYCDEVTNGALTYSAVKRDEVKFYVFGNDTVEEWWRDTSTMVYRGKTSHGPRKCSITYSRVNGQWLDVAHMTSLYTVEQ